MERIPLTKDEASLIKSFAETSFKKPGTLGDSIAHSQLLRLLCPPLSPNSPRDDRILAQFRTPSRQQALHTYLRSGGLADAAALFVNEGKKEVFNWRAGTAGSPLGSDEGFRYPSASVEYLRGLPCLSLFRYLECPVGKEERFLVTLLRYMHRIQRKLLENKVGMTLHLIQFRAEICGSRSGLYVVIAVALEAVDPYPTQEPITVPLTGELLRLIRTPQGDESALQDLASNYGTTPQRGSGRNSPDPTSLPTWTPPCSSSDIARIEQAPDLSLAKMRDLALQMGDYCDPNASILLMDSYLKIISTLVKRDFYPA